MKKPNLDNGGNTRDHSERNQPTRFSPVQAHQPARNKVFISYSHKDKKWLEQLHVHLKPLERSGIVDRWDDTRIAEGQKWKEEISKAIDSARVAVLLISADFLASDFIVEDELPRLLAAAEKEGLVVLSVLLLPSLFSDTKSLSQFQAVNKPSRTLSDLEPPDQARVWIKVVKAIERELAVPLLSQPDPPPFIISPPNPSRKSPWWLQFQLVFRRVNGLFRHGRLRTYALWSLFGFIVLIVSGFGVHAVQKKLRQIQEAQKEANDIFGKLTLNDTLSPSEFESLLQLASTNEAVRYRFIDMALTDTLWAIQFEGEMAIHAAVGMDATIQQGFLARVDSAYCFPKHGKVCGMIEEILLEEAVHTPIALPQRPSDPNRKLTVGAQPRLTIPGDTPNGVERHKFEAYQSAGKTWDTTFVTMEDKMGRVDTLLRSITSKNEDAYWLREVAGDKLMPNLIEVFPQSDKSDKVIPQADPAEVVMVTKMLTDAIENIPYKTRKHSRALEKLGEGLSYIARGYVKEGTIMNKEDAKDFMVLLTDAIDRNYYAPFALEQLAGALRIVSQKADQAIEHQQVIDWLKWPTCIQGCRYSFVKILYINTSFKGRLFWDVPAWAERRNQSNGLIDIRTPPLPSRRLRADAI